MILNIFKSFFQIINWRTLVASVLSLISAYLCIEFQIKAEFPFYLISIAIVFRSSSPSTAPTNVASTPCSSMAT